MKRLTLITLMLAISLSSFSMSISKSRRYSLFLTDKMAYELDLTNEQFEAVYEINFDYFRSIYRNSDIDLYWPVRDQNMYYVLDDYQYAVYCVIDYFYDPIYYLKSRWSLGIYNYYTDRSYYYRSYPLAYRTYRGAHIYAPTYYMDRAYMRPIHHDNMHPSKTPTPDQMNNGRFANRGSRTNVNRSTEVNNGGFVDNGKNGKKNNSGQDDTYSVGRPSVSSSSTSSNRPSNISTRPTNNSSSITTSSNDRSNSTSRTQSNSNTPSTSSRSTSVTTGRSNDSSTSVSSGRSTNNSSNSSSRSSSVSSGRSNSNSSSNSSRSSSVSSGRSTNNSSSNSSLSSNVSSSRSNSSSSSSTSSRSSSVSSGRGGGSSSSSGVSGRGGRR